MSGHRNRRTSRKDVLGYESLEARQVLTSFYWGVDAGVLHAPQDTSIVVLENLEEAPEISQTPEHGELIFSESDGTLTYQPDNGFTGADTFTTSSSLFGDQNKDYDIRIWEPVFATPDWSSVAVDGATSLNVVENDYALIPREWGGYKWQSEGIQFSIVEVSVGSQASVGISADRQSISYSAANGFTGLDVVTYTLEDEFGNRTEGSATFEVSDLDFSGAYFVSESQWQHDQIEDWMESHSESLTAQHFRYVDILLQRTPLFFSLQADSLSANGQVAGVQEGDIVKVQDNLVFYVTHETDVDSEFASYLTIVDLSDGSSPELISSIGFENQIQDVFVNEDRVAVITDQSASIQYAFDGTETVAQTLDLFVIDINDPSQPQQVSQSTIEGSYIDARLIGDQLYLINNRLSGLPSPDQVFAADSGITPVSPGDYIAAIMENDATFGLPSVTVDANGIPAMYTMDFGQVLNRDNGLGFTLISTFDIGSDEGLPVDMDLIGSDAIGTVYVSNQSTYLFDHDSIIKMDFDENGGVDFSADGELSASLLGQYSVDEHDGYLRLALTDVINGRVDIEVLSQVGDALVVVASLEDIAPGELIYSTRFAGDQAYVVTFEQIDPLFVIDLSNPTEPRIAGELKVPGFSNFLEPIGDNLILAVGRGATENGLSTGLQISLFDVSNPDAPTLLDRFEFDGGRSTKTPLVEWLRAAANRDAITYDPVTQIVSLPIFSAASWWGDGNEPIFSNEASAFSLFQVNRTDGIVSVGQIGFSDKALRTAVVGEHLVYLSESQLKTALRQDPTVVLAEMSIPQNGERPAGFVDNGSGSQPNEFEKIVPCTVELDATESNSENSDLAQRRVNYDVPLPPGWGEQDEFYSTELNAPQLRFIGPLEYQAASSLAAESLDSASEVEGALADEAFSELELAPLEWGSDFGQFSESEELATNLN